jgi:hypothetical protein
MRIGRERRKAVQNTSPRFLGTRGSLHLLRSDQSRHHSVHPRYRSAIRSVRYPRELGPAGNDEHPDGPRRRGHRCLWRQRRRDGPPPRRAMSDGAHGRCLGCRVRGAVPRLRRGQVHYRHRTGCRWRAYGELRLRRVTPNAKGRRRTAVATATFARAGMVGPPARLRSCCEFGENSHRDSIWEIPLNSSRVLDSGRHGTKRITVNNREEGRDGSLPHRPLRQC